MRSIGKRRAGAGRLVAVLALVTALASAAGLMMLASLPAPLPPLPPRAGPALAEARTWGYQLQGARAEEIDPAIDLLVVDYSRDGSAAAAYGAGDVTALRGRRDGSTRIVLAYMSIGEAENYRYYWQAYWRVLRPTWLGRENPEWKGNFPVRFWQPSWQRVIVNHERSELDRWAGRLVGWWTPYLDRIIEAGFDGVYLDRVDVFGEWSKQRATAERDMVAFVAAISTYARARRPGFLIVPQNGEELLQHADYVTAIDGIAKEDLLYGAAKDGKANKASDVTASLGHLLLARQAGLPVFVVEYVKRAATRRKITDRLTELGFVPLFASRELNVPPVPVLPQSPQPAGEPATPAAPPPRP
jgi:cysteinyl-tRNA synthetase